MVNVRKRGKGYQYYFEIAPVDGKRKQQVKSGFKTKKEAEEAGIKAYNEYTQTGHSFTPATMSYSDYLDYWLENYCHVNLKYHTIQAYTNIIKNHIRPRLGFYRLTQITTSTLQEFINNIYLEKGYSKNFLKNILKVLKTSFGYATDKAALVSFLGCIGASIGGMALASWVPLLKVPIAAGITYAVGKAAQVYFESNMKLDQKKI